MSDIDDSAGRDNRDAVETDSRPRPPVLVALGAQATAFAICFGLALVWRRSVGGEAELPLLLGLQGALAAGLGLKWGLARWWLPVQLILPLAGGAALMMDLPSWVFGAGFVLLALIFWNASGERVPLYLSNRRTWAALAEMIGDKPVQFIDIGCGVGGTLTHIARARPNAHVVGIESAPLPYALAWIRIKTSGLANVELLYGNFWRHDLAPYDYAYAFLSPAPMPALYEKARAELRSGATLISNSFAVPDAEPDVTKVLDDRRQTKLLIWRM